MKGENGKKLPSFWIPSLCPESKTKVPMKKPVRSLGKRKACYFLQVMQLVSAKGHEHLLPDEQQADQHERSHRSHVQAYRREAQERQGSFHHHAGSLRLRREQRRAQQLGPVRRAQDIVSFRHKHRFSFDHVV